MTLKSSIVLLICTVIASTQAADSTTTPKPKTYFDFKGTIKLKAYLVIVDPNQDASFFIILSNKDRPVTGTDPYLKIGLGDKSYIRRGTKEDNDDEIVVKTPGIMDKTEREFWIKLVPPATIMVGKATERIPFLFWTDPKPMNITLYGAGFCCNTTKGKWSIVNSEDNKDVSLCGLDVVNTNTANQLSKPIVNKKRTYQMIEEPLNWDEAKAACERKGQKLASVRNKEEQVELEKVIKGVKNPVSGVWLGANNRAQHNQFVWYDGSNDVVSFSNWATTSSNVPTHDRNCVFASYVTLLVQKSALWFTQTCKQENSFVCELIS